MVLKKHKIIFIVLLLSLSQSSYSEVIWGPSLGRSGGEYVFETGNRFPNLSGIRGGSRISFTRDYTQFGFNVGYFEKNWEVRTKALTSGWNQTSGTARDEDFIMGSTSQEQTTQIATREWAYYDSAHVFSGTRNFADGIGKSTLRHDSIELFGRNYFQDASPDYWKQGSGFFLSSGFRYSYFKYIFYDVNQFIDSRPVFYGPIGIGLSMSNDLYEFFMGGGYRYSGDGYYFDFSFQPSIGRVKARDFHYQRSINFLSDNIGFGWQSTIEAGYLLNDSWLTYLKLEHRRFFSEGSFKARGGLTREDILANVSGGFKSHINIKDFNVELGVLNKVNWNAPKETD
ncbi:putative porin [Leptospira ryugenii]|nr:putative porin [Leptospira ryugenii]